MPKQEPHSSSPGGYRTGDCETDGYETDEAELDLDHALPDGSIWLVGLPPYIKERWNDILEDEPIELGTIKTRLSNGKPETKLVLNAQTPANTGLPTEYDFNIKDKEVGNPTFCFTEGDRGKMGHDLRSEIPRIGLKRKIVDKAAPQIPYKFTSRSREEYRREANIQQKTPRVSERRSNYRTALHIMRELAESGTEKTALFGKITQQMRMAPTKGGSYSNFILPTKAPAHKISLLEKPIMPSLLYPGAFELGKEIGDTTFKNIPRRNREKKDKAVRISQQELLTELFDCFDIQSMWSIKELRQKLSQPEAFLKETLEQIATYHPNGPKFGKWTIKSEYRVRKAQN